MVLDGDGLTVEVRLGVVGRVLAVGHRHGTEIGTGGTVFVHIALRDHRHRGRRRAQPVRVGPAVLHPAGIRVHRQPGHHLTEAELGALVEGPVGDHHLGHPGRHRERGLLDGRGGSAAAVADLAEELQIPDPGRAGHGGLQVGVHRERHQTVDVRRRQPRVIERVEDRLGGQSQLAAPGVLGEVGGPDTGDGRLAGEHQSSPNVSVAVAITWLPRLLAPVTLTVTNSPSTSVTSPEKVTVS